MDNVDIREMSGVVLAYLGDSVWELEIRKYWIEKKLNLSNLNKNVKKYVNAKKQSQVYKRLIEEVDERYRDIGRRAKNGNIKSYPKSCTALEYREATAFEAIIGVFYLEKRYDLIEKAIKICIEEE